MNLLTRQILNEKKKILFVNLFYFFYFDKKKKYSMLSFILYKINFFITYFNYFLILIREMYICIYINIYMYYRVFYKIVEEWLPKLHNCLISKCFIV